MFCVIQASKDFTPLCDSKYEDTAKEYCALWIHEKTYNSISEIVRSLQTIEDAGQELIFFEKLKSVIIFIFYFFYSKKLKLKKFIKLFF